MNNAPNKLLSIVKTISAVRAIKEALSHSNKGLDGVVKHRRILSPQQILEIEYHANETAVNINTALIKIIASNAKLLEDAPDFLLTEVNELATEYAAFVKRKELIFGELIPSTFVFTPTAA